MEIPAKLSVGFANAIASAVGAKSAALHGNRLARPAGIFPGQSTIIGSGAEFFSSRKSPAGKRKLRFVSENFSGAELLVKNTATLLVSRSFANCSNNLPMPPSRRVMSAARFLAACGHGWSENGASLGTGKSSAPVVAVRGAGRFTSRKNGR